jgi:hypothetical protein
VVAAHSDWHGLGILWYSDATVATLPQSPASQGAKEAPLRDRFLFVEDL